MASEWTSREDVLAGLRARFVAWVMEGGGFVHPNLRVLSSLPNRGSDRGVICNGESIKANETLILIPPGLCLYMPLHLCGVRPDESDESDKSTSTSEEEMPAAVTFLAALEHKPSPFICTVLILLAEAALGLKSFYAPYIDTLPEGHDSLIAWTDAELSLLQGTELECQTDGRKKTTQDIFVDVVLPIIKDASELWPLSFCTADRFDWAFGCVQTRAFQLNDQQGNDPTLYLIPGVDMLNHTSMKDAVATTLQRVKSSNGQDDSSHICHESRYVGYKIAVCIVYIQI
jgi:hypothetical protein